MSMHTAGRRMDALVAPLMGWESSLVGNMPWQMIPPGDDRFHVRTVPYYSTDIAAAWTVVEKLALEGYEPSITFRDGTWEAGFRCADLRNDRFRTADTAPLAICRAALALPAHPPEVSV